ncbi:Protein of unknown function DUF3529 [Ostreococcus tauri]|uniref:Uncharacterized protein n=1 Tax=Ostreococcus tauri TaxID=70448 RepID=A0A090N3M6_OSTTA|nr:Protein of unknown function DUF3529 [Ostreococcus tauri]CEF98383.1 Protein of unknown function DUF3529 [Ostreococcus tauri]|eukprot:XP_022839234.1 Protein of unknown function DUF3529 [Ostreococcus tauri]
MSLAFARARATPSRTAVPSRLHRRPSRARRVVAASDARRCGQKVCDAVTVAGVTDDDDASTRAEKSTSLRSTPAGAVSALALWNLSDGSLAEGTSNSYYATLFLFILSAPGLYSLVKRSAKSKIARKTFEVDGPSVRGATPQDELAKDIFTFFKRNNYVVADAGEVITFEGNIAPERGTAAYITFCVLIGLLCVGLVCSIALPGGDAWYALALASPLSGKYYLDNAGRKEQVKVKMVTSDDDATIDITIEGDADEIERFRREMDLTPKGMVRVKGILEKA